MIKSGVLLPREEQYKLTWDSYTGGGGFASGEYIDKFRRETVDNYAVRVMSSAYTNRVTPIVQAQVAPVFSQPAKRGATNMDDMLSTFLKDVDNNGTNIQDAVRLAVENTKVLGNYFIVVDNFKTCDLPDTKDDVVSGRKMPYIYTKSVMDVSDYKQDQYGRLTEITFYYGAGAPSEDAEQCYVYKTFSCNGTTHFTTFSDGSNKVTLNETIHGFGRVPVVFYNKTNVTPQPPFYQLAKQSKKLYNIESEINDLQKTQSFSILLLPSRNPNTEKDGSVVISKHNAIDFDSESTNAPSFISPDSSLMDSSLAYYESVKDDMISAADILGSMAGQRGSKSESGKTLAIKWFGKMQNVKDVARMSEFIENGIVDLFGLYVGKDYDYTVTYSDKFMPTYDEVTLKQATNGAFLKMNVSPVTNLQVKEDMVSLHALQNNWSQEKLDEALDSLDGSPVLENEFETKNQAV